MYIFLTDFDKLFYEEVQKERTNYMTIDGRHRKNIYLGLEVEVILKKDQRSGVRTAGVVKDLLTNSSYHPHGIKVRLEDGQVGRVCP